MVAWRARVQTALQMDTSRLLRITTAMNLLLQRDLGLGIDVWRTMNEPRYALDVLLVCEARPGSDLAKLAGLFRATRAKPVDSVDIPLCAQDSHFGDLLPVLNVVVSQQAA
jgi:hypothetical protein